MHYVADEHVCAQSDNGSSKSLWEHIECIMWLVNEDSQAVEHTECIMWLVNS